MTYIKDLNSDALSNLQKDLANLGYYPYYLIDGLWGEMTNNAFKQFAVDHWLNNSKTGLIGSSYTDTLEEEVKQRDVNKMSSEDVERISRRYGYDPILIRAFLNIESNGTAFWSGGHPPILYEAHIFHAETDGRWGNYDDLSSTYWNSSLYKGGLAEYSRLYRASRLDYLAAFKSCSWGLGQVLGSNASSLGYRSVTLMVKEAHQSAENQIEHVIKFLERNNISDDLEREDWDKVAYVYNGPGYRKNNYAVRLAQETERLRRL